MCCDVQLDGALLRRGGWGCSGAVAETHKERLRWLTVRSVGRARRTTTTLNVLRARAVAGRRHWLPLVALARSTFNCWPVAASGCHCPCLLCCVHARHARTRAERMHDMGHTVVTCRTRTSMSPRELELLRTRAVWGCATGWHWPAGLQVGRVGHCGCPTSKIRPAAQDRARRQAARQARGATCAAGGLARMTFKR